MALRAYSSFNYSAAISPHVPDDLSSRILGTSYVPWHAEDRGHWTITLSYILFHPPPNRNMPHKDVSELVVNELHPTFAAELHGVDFSSEISPEVFDEIYQAITKVCPPVVSSLYNTTDSLNITVWRRSVSKHRIK